GNQMHTDDTVNQTAGGGTTAGGANYPSGPYGYVKGSVIENISFSGKLDPAGAAGTATYSALPMAPVSLSDYHADANVKYVVLSGVAGWCPPCNDEQTQVPAMQQKYEPQGVRFLEALIEGYNRTTHQAATEDDVNRWADRHKLHVGIAIDPEDKIHAYAD